MKLVKVRLMDPPEGVAICVGGHNDLRSPVSPVIMCATCGRVDALVPKALVD